MEIIRLRYYLTEEGKNPFDQWLMLLGSPATVARIMVRLTALRAGRVVDIAALEYHTVFALTVANGPGYHVYLARIGSDLVLLLHAGLAADQAEGLRVARARLHEILRGRRT